MDPSVAIPLALACAALAGLANGIGVGVFRVHPLIMTLAVGLVVEGLLLVYQRLVLGSSVESRRPSPGSARDAPSATSPTRCSSSCRSRCFMVCCCAAPASGGCSTRSATTRARRACPACAYWQVIIVLYVLSGAPRGHRRAALRRPHQGHLAVAGRAARAAVGGRGGHRRHVDLRRPRRLRRAPSWAPSSSRCWPRCSSCSQSRRARAASSSGSSSWPSRRPTRASPRSAEGARHEGRHAPHRPRPRRHQHQVGAGRARGRRVADARPGPGADRHVRRRAHGRAAAGRRSRSRSATAPAARWHSLGVAVPGLYIPETGVVTFLTNVPGDWSATPVGEPVAAATGLPTALINDARAFGLAELRFGAGRDVRSFVGLTLGTGIGGRHRHRRPGRAGLPRPGRRAGPPDHRPRRALVRLRQPRLRRGLRAGRPGGHRLRHGGPAGGHRAGAGGRRAGAGRAWPRSAATWASASPTPSRC